MSVLDELRAKYAALGNEIAALELITTGPITLVFPTETLTVTFGPNSMTWQQATAWAATNSVRLPTRLELQIIANNELLPWPNRGWYWSSTNVYKDMAKAWLVNTINSETVYREIFIALYPVIGVSP